MVELDAGMDMETIARIAGTLAERHVFAPLVCIPDMGAESVGLFGFGESADMLGEVVPVDDGEMMPPMPSNGFEDIPVDHDACSTRGRDFDEGVTRVGARESKSLGELAPNGRLQEARVETVPTRDECETTENRVGRVTGIDLLEHPPHLVEGRGGP